MLPTSTGVLSPTPVHHIHRMGEIQPVPRSVLGNLSGSYRSVAKLMEDLALYGINISEKDLNKMHGFAMDGQPTVTIPSSSTPIQFLQNWLPGTVNVITNARKSDLIMDLMITGNWSDEQVVRQVMEQTGSAVPYGDYTTVPYSSFNVNYVYRNVIRFEEGMQIGRLESEQAARANINNDAQKRNAAALALEIERNYIAFYGYNGGSNNTYGFLNDPSLPSYVTASTGAASSTLWANKTFLEIVNDIKGMFARLRNQSGDQIDTNNVPTMLTIATASVDYLSTVSDFNQSVKAWLTESYPRCTVESAPELNAANGSANVAYLYARQITDDYSTDGGSTVVQLIPTKFQTLGVTQDVKTYTEGYTNATAGIMVQRPWAFQRLTGI